MFRALMSRGYKGWISLEAFDFSMGGEKILQDTITYLKAEAAAAAQE